MQLNKYKYYCLVLLLSACGFEHTPPAPKPEIAAPKPARPKLPGEISPEHVELLNRLIPPAKLAMQKYDDAKTTLDTLQHLFEPKSPVDKLEEALIRVQNTWGKALQSGDALNLITNIKKSFHADNSYFFDSSAANFWQILLDAAKSRDGRDALLRGIKYEKGKSWFYENGLSSETWNKLLFRFSSLKKDLDALEALVTDLQSAEDIPWWDRPRDLDQYEPFFQLFVQFEAELPDLLSFALKRYGISDKPLKDITDDELKELLTKLSTWLTDTDKGLAWLLKEMRTK